MIIRQAVLETVCGITSKLPTNAYNEYAFAGKSNVGKSSLINTLMNRKSLARTSASPGKTQTINYYLVDTKDNGFFYLVDLPGYGYASVGKVEKEKWGAMIENYLHSSSKLKIIFLLVDIRHKPTEDDRLMYDWIVYNGYTPVIIATKADKIKRSQMAACIKLIKTTFNADNSISIIPFSAQSKQGLDDIYKVVENTLQ